MAIKSVFSLLLLVHVLCDFYFQTEKVALKKRENWRWVLFHSAVYVTAAGFLLYILLPGLPYQYVIAFGLSHGFVDIMKYVVCGSVYRTDTPARKLRVFLLDQAVHIAIIGALAYQMKNFDTGNLFRSELKTFFSDFGISIVGLLSWSLKLLLLHKPLNILISGFLSSYKPIPDKTVDAAESEAEADKNMGRLIGTLERIIMSIFISINQYSAIGLVLTAKSIARYDRIEKQQSFAEYYLLGTLLSTIGAVVVSLMF